MLPLYSVIWRQPIYRGTKTADANGNYAFTFPELNNIKNGTYSILTNSTAPSSVQEKTFSYIEQPLPKNVILADNNADFGILTSIAQEYERLINSDADTKSSAEVWQCYFLDKWLKEFTGLVCVTSVNHTEEGYMITFSNLTISFFFSYRQRLTSILLQHTIFPLR